MVFQCRCLTTGKVVFAVKMEKNQNTGRTEDALTGKLRQATQEIREIEGKTKEVDQATKTMLVRIAKVDEEIESAKDKRESLNKTNQILQEYSLALEESLGIIIV